MAIQSENTNLMKIDPITPMLDYEKWLARWNNLYKISNEAEPAVGTTPRQTIWKKNKSVLWYYPAQGEVHRDTPIYLIYSLFNRPFILDLAPGNSLIEGLVKLGYDVYLLDWGIPALEDKDLKLDDYICTYMDQGFKRVLRHSGASQVTLAGYCLGGTLATIYAALFPHRPIQNLVIWTVPIDFKNMALPPAWIEALRLGLYNVDRLVDMYGLIPAEFVNFMFKIRKAPGNFLNHYASLFHLGWNREFINKWRKMYKWTQDQVPFAGEAFRQLVKDFMKDNKLSSGQLMIRGERVDLKKITVPMLIVEATRDDLVLGEQSKNIGELVSSTDITYQSLDAGHVSLVLSKKFPVMLHKWLEKGLKEKAQAV